MSNIVTITIPRTKKTIQVENRFAMLAFNLNHHGLETESIERGSNESVVIVFKNYDKTIRFLRNMFESSKPQHKKTLDYIQNNVVFDISFGPGMQFGISWTFDISLLDEFDRKIYHCLRAPF